MDSTTDLARAWEATHELRRRAQMLQLASRPFFQRAVEKTCIKTLHAVVIYVNKDMLVAKVQFKEGNIINRDTLVHNEQLLTECLSHLGTRVSIRTLELHIRSCYDFMKIPVSSAFGKKYSSIMTIASRRTI